MIGRVGTILGEAGVNIDDMDVGRDPTGAPSTMVVACVDSRVDPSRIFDAAPGEMSNGLSASSTKPWPQVACAATCVSRDDVLWPLLSQAHCSGDPRRGGALPVPR